MLCSAVSWIECSAVSLDFVSIKLLRIKNECMSE